MSLGVGVGGLMTVEDAEGEGGGKVEFERHHLKKNKKKLNSSYLFFQS